MAARREGGIGIPVTVTPKVDERSALEVTKRLSKLKTEWASVAQSSRISLKEIQQISSKVANFGKVLSHSAKDWGREVKDLGSKLQDAVQKAEDLSKMAKHADTPEEKEKLSEEFQKASDAVQDLKDQIDDHHKANQKYGRELRNTIRAQQKFTSSLEKSADYSKADAVKDILKSLGKGLSSGNVGGVKAGLAGAGQHAAQGIQGGMARTALNAGDSDPGSMSKTVQMLGSAASGIGAIAVAVGALWGFIKAASEHQTKLNKALLDGTGFVNDFTSDTRAYKQTVDDLRGATQDAAGSLLKYGGNSEIAAKAINAFAKESTGSLIKTRDTLKSLGKGDIAAGVEEFSRNAMVYGKALGMESTEVAGMMGKLVSEAGYGAEKVQDLMGNVVKAAATANMPMTKFMGIFRSVLPDVELYQNRLEELTGTIKLLSKTMSPKDVQNFMNAFSKGFQGMDFKQRLKTVLVAGTGFVSQTLGKDFDMKAKAMAQNFEKYATPDMGSFADAMKGGEASMAKYVAKAQANAARQGAEISGTQIGDAMKLASNEAARRKGGPLNVATAMRGAGVYSTYKILNKFGQTLTTGFDGLSEHVMKQLGISEQQYEALRTTSQSLKTQKAFLQQYGKTNSKSMNKALRETIAMRKNIKADDVTQKDMQNATDEDLFQAAELSNTLKKGQQTAEDLAQQQASSTLSIDDKISNVIAFLLEKIFKASSGILDKLDEIMNSLPGFFSGKPAEVKKWDQMSKALDDIKESYKGEGVSKQNFEFVADMMKKQIQAGGTPDMLINTFKQMLDPSAFGGDEKLQLTLERIRDSSQDLPGDLMKLLTTKDAQVSQRVENKAAKRASERSETRRPGTQQEKVYRTSDEKKAAQEAADLETDLEEIVKNTRASADSQQEIADSSPARSTAGGGQIPGQTAGSPASPKPSADAKHSVEATESLHKAVEDQTQDQSRQGEDIYDGIKDVAGILRKGIKYEKSWMGTVWLKTLKEGTLESFQAALLEFAIIEAKMGDEKFKGELAKRGTDVLGTSLGLSDIAGVKDYTDPEKELSALISGSRQTGGPIPDTGLYKLHRGEYVVPAMAASGAGGGRGSVTANITINGTGLSPQQLEGAVFNAMDQIARRS